MLTARQQSGRRAEELAAEFLRARGFEILQRNYLRRLGELDLVARRADLLVIAEGRTRSSAAYGGAAAGGDRGKKQRITRPARQPLQQRADLAPPPGRFDGIVVWGPHSAPPRLEWVV